ncbi:ATP-grasp domain-containing protein [Candidatus Dependentiae bacterium]|nr:ATP-grasp domain-containing protein [Candidatus Dependentiae bacterium]
MYAQKKIRKILIANRGEIVSRINFSCQKNDIQTISIYSQEDQYMPYIFATNQNHKLSLCGNSAYLNQEEIINIALKTKADAIHPGYGFLSENSQFAQMVVDANLIWIGPDPETIKLMGNKSNARETMKKSNIPIIPGLHFLRSEKNKAKKYAQKIGYPIILKDPLGGGGKAIKKIGTPEEFEYSFDSIFEQTQKMTQSNFILIEKHIKNGRHIEIQIAGDGKNYIHLHERECSIQRRHQKIIEEAPCNFLNKKILAKMYETALIAAKAVKYKNIGTVEFIVTQNQDFYFLEMNTRLQVEHSVTEFTTNVDLVDLQIHIAQKNMLPLKQKDIKQKNHAIECRIYSEDPQNNFLPTTGTINNLQFPEIFFLRHDHNLEINQEITSFFDPMISKLTCWGKNRKEAIKNMLIALSKFKIDGIKNNIDFLKSILKTKEFYKGKIHTQILKDLKYYNKVIAQQNTNMNNDDNFENQIAIIAAHLFSEQKSKHQKFLFQEKHTYHWRKQRWK